MIPEYLQNAFAQRVDRQLVPLRAVLDGLRGALEEFEGVSRAIASKQVEACLLSALGADHREDGELITARRRVLVAIENFVRALLSAEDLGVEPQPAVQPAPADATGSVDRRGAVLRLLAEVDAFERMDVRTEHPLRMRPLMQALVAEARHMLTVLPETDNLRPQLERVIPRMTRVNSVHNFGFIKGLARDHVEDWERLAVDSRRRLARFDVDVECAPSSGPKSSRTSAISTHRPSTPPCWPELPALRAVLGSDVLPIIGGKRREEKLRLVRERLGVNAEWAEIEPGSPRTVDAVVERLRNGRVRAAIIVEGFMGHDVWRRVQEACDAGGVRYALANRAGLAQLESALKELDERLGRLVRTETPPAT